MAAETESFRHPFRQNLLGSFWTRIITAFDGVIRLKKLVAKFITVIMSHPQIIWVRVAPLNDLTRAWLNL